VPPTGIEPVHLPPEGSALSPELRGLVGVSLRLSAGANNSAYCKNSRMRSTAYFATGCFWGAERRFWQMDGVIETSVGYMGGVRPHPSYEQVCTGVTGHAEMVKVVFDPTVVSYQRLLEEFWTMHDPTSLNQQGGDIGTQYRSAIYTEDDEQMKTALASQSAYQAVLTAAGLGQICTEILSADGIEYYEAEEYHQKYLQKNPNGYDCHSSTGVAYPV
jgi:peptide-methionine (S)-S-oxide reductase